MKTRLWRLTLAVGLLASASGLMAQSATRDAVRLSYVLPLIHTIDLDQLEGVAFSIHNQSDQGLAWIKIQVVVRNPANEIIYSKPTEVDLEGYFGEPIAPGVITQLTVPLHIRGYRTMRGDGSIDLRLLDSRLSP